MNNEPVAWAIKVGKDLVEIVDEKRDFQELVDFYKMEKWDFETVELYTTPQIKELSEKNLNELCPHHEGTATYSVWMNGARTVLGELNKASEK